MRLVFADTAAGIRHAAQLGAASGDLRIVALSAEALEAARATGVECEAVGRLGRGGRELLEPQSTVFGRWFEALADLERELAAEFPECRFEGPGIFVSRAYPIAFAINSVRARAGLMAAAVTTLAPQSVTVIETYRDARYAGDGYTHNPWTVAFEAWARGRSLPVDIVDACVAHTASLRERVLGAVRRQRWLLKLRDRMRGARAPEAPPPHMPGLESMRVLFSDSTAYDWSPAVRLLERGGAATFTVARAPEPARDEFASYAWAAAPGFTDASLPVRIGAVFDRWAEQSSWPSRLAQQGIDAFGALRPYLRRLAQTGPDVLRRADAIAESMLDVHAPNVVCFLVVAYPYQKRLAHACRRRGIPVVCYQHGGAYGTHDVAVHDFVESSDADAFLVYGPQVLPRPDPVLPHSARHVAVGSARLEGLARPPEAGWRRATRGLHVIFAGDVTYRNTLTAGTEIEDTARFDLETAALTALAASPGIRVTYRPFPAQLEAQGTPAWLARQGFTNVEQDARTPTPELLQGADLIVTLSTSGTLWNEAIAIGVPMVAHADPAYTQLSPGFRATLARAALLCESAAEFKTAVREIAASGAEFLARFADKGRAEFLRDYVLADGNCARAAVGFLASIRA